MSNPFKQNKNYEGKPKRNTFDLSFRNHFTANFGQLLPVFCKPVIPGDHFRIRANFGLRFMPTAFPIMNKIRAHVHFFYVRNRNLWVDFTDFIYNNKENLDPPYMPNDSNSPIYTTGSLSDYLGVPTTLTSYVIPCTSGTFLDVDGGSEIDDSNRYCLDYTLNSVDSSHTIISNNYNYNNISIVPYSFKYASPSESGFDSVNVDAFDFSTYSTESLRKIIPVVSQAYESKNDNLFGYGTGLVNPSIQQNPSLAFPFFINTLTSTAGKKFVVEVYIPKSEIALTQNKFIAHCLFSNIKPSVTSFNQGGSYIGLPTSINDITSGVNSHGVDCYVFKFTTPEGLPQNYHYINFILNIPCSSARDVFQSSEVILRTTIEHGDYSGKFNVYGSDGNQVPLSALPYRAYESIYNSFYRDSRNNPYVLNGSVEYNKYIPTQEGGLDTNLYEIHYRNWELDQFTSCVQSPQQGVAPLVGITSTGQVTFQGDDGVTRTYTTETADDADTITKVNVNSGEAPDPSTARAIVDLVSSGISINDFRNVNAFQRWKETNIRRGMKLRDQTLARWGVDISYNTLDMPEFIGGISTDVDVNAVFQTVETPEVPLGSFAGAASAFGGTKNDVSQYCDEHGFIIGILSIVPTPVYDCILPKWLTKQNCLDYFNPEFDHIGMQPVRYSELCPVTAVAVANNDDSDDTMQRTFGYQRPWYEYIYSNDEMHGLFRTQLRNFVLSRSFSGLPELNASFTTIQPGSLNNVFTTDVGDKIIGSISFDVTAKRPISAISIPTL